MVVVWGTLLLWGVGGAPLHAQPPEEPSPAEAQEPPGQEESPTPAGDEQAPHQSTHYRAYKKVRSGSMIRKVPDDWRPPDLRGDYQRRRDHQVVVHFRRLARLDVIAQVAAKAGDTNLADRVEEVRRAENERFRRAMENLRQTIRIKTETGLP